MSDDFEPKVISPALRKRLQRCFEHGQQTVNQSKPDYGYASKSFVQCVVGDPGNITYVEAFLDNLQKKYDNNKKGGSFMGFGGKGPFKKAVKEQHWENILTLGPELLDKSPWDASVLRPMAQACAYFFYNEVEVRYLKMALDGNPKDIELCRHCASSLGRMGNFDQAIAVLSRITDLKKNDKEATRLIGEFSVQKATSRSGFEFTKRLSPEERERLKRFEKMKDKLESRFSERVDRQETPREKREIELTQRQVLEQAIRDAPVIVENYIALAELLAGENRFAESIKVLERGLAASGNDLAMQERLEELQIADVKHRLAIAKQQEEKYENEEARELTERLRETLLRLELDFYSARVERYPSEVKYKSNRAQCLIRSGNFAEAIKALQELRDFDAYRIPATMEMGECLQRLRQFPKALLCYQKVALEAVADNHQEHRKLAMYRGGVLAGGLKDYDTAANLLSALRELDANYKDVADRLDKLRQIRNKE